MLMFGQPCLMQLDTNIPTVFLSVHCNAQIQMLVEIQGKICNRHAQRKKMQIYCMRVLNIYSCSLLDCLMLIAQFNQMKLCLMNLFDQTNSSGLNLPLGCLCLLSKSLNLLLHGNPTQSIVTNGSFVKFLKTSDNLRCSSFVHGSCKAQLHHI